MADVEISYNNSVIASLNDSGTEVLETNGTFMADDVTITYTKSGGGGSTTNVSFNALGTVYYLDSSGTATTANANGTFSASVISGSLITAVLDNSATSSFSNCTLINSISLGTRANYRYADIIQAN